MCLCTARLPENIAWFEARFADMLPPGLPCGKLVQRPRTKATGIGKHCLVRGEGHGGMVLHGGANESGTCAAKFSSATKKPELIVGVLGLPKAETDLHCAPDALDRPAAQRRRTVQPCAPARAPPDC
jgi:hypothetical protein